MKELCKHYSVTNNFHSMVTLRNLIQSGDICAIIVRNIFARFYTWLTIVQKQQFEGLEMRTCWSHNHLCKTAVKHSGHSFYVFYNQSWTEYLEQEMVRSYFIKIIFK